MRVRMKMSMGDLQVMAGLVSRYSLARWSMRSPEAVVTYTVCTRLLGRIATMIINMAGRRSAMLTLGDAEVMVMIMAGEDEEFAAVLEGAQLMLLRRVEAEIEGRTMLMAPAINARLSETF